VLEKKHWRAFLILAMSLTVGAFIVALSSSDVRMQIVKSTTRQPTPFTELYFTNAQSLPKDLRGEGPFTFQFTIANHEGRVVGYSYLVTAADTGGTTPITHGAVVIESGQSTPLPVSFVPARIDTTYLVTVQLVGRPETIHFRATS
jgi:hypothetical protein